MNTLMQQTSLFVYNTKIKPKLSERQKLVYEKLQTQRNFTNKELAYAFSCDACSITGRIKELRDMDLVRFSEKRKCKITGNTAIAWEIGIII